MNIANIPPTVEAYTEMQVAYDHFNSTLFDGALPSCLITWQREGRFYGYFAPERFLRHDGTVRDEIAMNPAWFAVTGLEEMMQTLVHEMVHLWQHHHGKPGRRGYHNREWAGKMEAIGLMPSSTGRPGGARTGEQMADYPIAGGPFGQALAALLTQSFRLSWVERGASLVKIQQAAATHEVEADEIVDELAEVGVAIAPQPNRSNREKYRCPTCGAQVWGKPGLSLICGADGAAL